MTDCYECDGCRRIYWTATRKFQVENVKTGEVNFLKLCRDCRRYENIIPVIERQFGRYWFLSPGDAP